KPKGGKVVPPQAEPAQNGACSQRFLDNKGDTWSDKTKPVNVNGSNVRDERGVSWGKKGGRVHGPNAIDFCTWKGDKADLGNSASNSAAIGASAYQELGVSWGRKTRSGFEWRSGWRVE